MIRITKVEFENYRQYKSVNVSFDDSGEHDLHILKAQNGTGKTTFLNGILWCLYSHEHYLSDKGKDTNPDERLLFRNREDAQEYIDTFLNENFRIEDCWIADVYIEQFNIKIN
jgi:DNA sulfur modification protein DndD